MKKLSNIIKESKDDNVYCLWDYVDNGGNKTHDILIWKGNGRDQSSIDEAYGKGTELLNVSFEEIKNYLKNKAEKVDRILLQTDERHLDFNSIKELKSIY